MDLQAMTSTSGSPNLTPVLIIRPSKGWISLRLRDIWEFRELLYFLVWRDLKVRYKQTILGVVWVVLQPVMTMLVFSIFFGRLIGVPTDGIPYPIFSITALIPWQFFANSITVSGNSLVVNQHLITKIYFPRLIIPIAAVFSGLIDFAVAFGVMIVILVMYGITPTATVLALPFFLLLVISLTLAVGLWLSALNVQYRDVQHTIPFLVQFWFFGSPIVYSSNLVPETWRAWYALNPVVGIVEGFRWALVGKPGEIGTLVVVSTLVIVVLLIGGLVYFRRVEKIFPDVV